MIDEEVEGSLITLEDNQVIIAEANNPKH